MWISMTHLKVWASSQRWLMSGIGKSTFTLLLPGVPPSWAKGTPGREESTSSEAVALP